MSKYLLFGGSKWYPSGGWNDYIGEFDSIPQVLAHLNKNKFDVDWIHVVDTATKQIVDLENSRGI